LFRHDGAAGGAVVRAGSPLESAAGPAQLLRKRALRRIPTMLLCQLSDPHIVEKDTRAYGRVDTPQYLERCVRRILALPRLPDAVVATGDLTDHGTVAEYGVLAELLTPLTMPVFLVVGNHDDRDALRQAFPAHRHLAGEHGFVQYAIDDFAVRLVVLDTVVPGAPGGELCQRRLQWLERTLAASSRPTIVAQHHPPFATGLSVMDRMGLAEPGAEAAVVARHPHVERVLAGHVHRTIQARFGGTIASTCPSTAHQLLLDLVPGADIRFTAEPAGFQLHLWNGEQVVSHSEVADDYPVWGARD
jgi:3',5'-cyclic AMP phosphodiesterase CpdA